MLALFLVLGGAWGMPGGSEQSHVDTEDAGGNSGGRGDTTVDAADPDQWQQRREDEEDEDEQEHGNGPAGGETEDIEEDTNTSVARVLALRMTAREAAGMAPHCRQMMRIEAVGAEIADMVLIPEMLTDMSAYVPPSRITPGPRELVASMTGNSEAGFTTTTYRMTVDSVSTVRTTHAEWFIATRRMEGLGPRLVVRHFTLP